MIAIFRRWRADRARRVALREIRRTCALFGRDLSDLTDEEIERGAMAAARAIGRAGIPAADAIEAIRRASRVGPSSGGA